MSNHSTVRLLQRVLRHLREHTPKEQQNSFTNEQLKREGKPNGGDAPRLLIDLELEIQDIQRG